MGKYSVYGLTLQASSENYDAEDQSIKQWRLEYTNSEGGSQNGDSG
jgi:hypothetical protein